MEGVTTRKRKREMDREREKGRKRLTEKEDIKER